jgi:hypothetical protein
MIWNDFKSNKDLIRNRRKFVKWSQNIQLFSVIPDGDTGYNQCLMKIFATVRDFIREIDSEYAIYTVRIAHRDLSLTEERYGRTSLWDIERLLSAYLFRIGFYSLQHRWYHVESQLFSVIAVRISAAVKKATRCLRQPFNSEWLNFLNITGTQKAYFKSYGFSSKIIYLKTEYRLGSSICWAS